MPATAKQPKQHSTESSLKPLPPTPPKASRKISRDTLINRLNCLHFQSGTLLALLTHHHGQRLSLRVSPKPLSEGKTLECRWIDTPPESTRLKGYTLEHLQIADGQNILKVCLDGVTLTPESLCGSLPEVCEELALRRFRRLPCSDIKAQVIQNGSVFTGDLADYSAAGIRLELTTQPPQTFQWLTNSERLTVALDRDGQTLLTTQAKIIRRQGDRHNHTVVLEPETQDLRRFAAKKYRSRRLNLRPSPTVRFSHPLTGRQQRLEVIDLSGSGCSVRELVSSASLLPGMTLPNLEICFADSLIFRCQAQVVYRRDEEDKVPTYCYGLAILDMEIEDHNRLLNLLHQADNHRQMICSQIDMDALWEFFFSSGFIYPKKYQALQADREKFLEAYTRLYQETPRIARHYVLQDNDTIQGHMSMLRLFSTSWLIHHHAAERNQARQTGLDILRLVGESVNEAQSLYSAHMEHVLCYYRPENRFPQRVFGGVASHYNDPGQCSIDNFAYFHYRKEFDLIWKDGGAWELAPALEEDLVELQAWYDRESGGLLLKALDLTPRSGDSEDLQEGYRQSGFNREHLTFVLKHEGEITALFMVLKTQVGLNLSNLANAISVIITDPDKLTREAFFTTVSMLASKYPVDEIPILVYPDSYPVNQGIEIEKNYNLWVLDCQNLDPYFEFCDNYFRRLKRREGDT